MIHFFGILSPAFGKRAPAGDAPAKADFFGGLPDPACNAVPLSRAEPDACCLTGRHREPGEDDTNRTARFARFCLPGLL